MRFPKHLLPAATLLGGLVILLIGMFFFADRRNSDPRVQDPRPWLEGILLQAHGKVFVPPSFRPLIPERFHPLLADRSSTEAALGSIPAFSRLNREQHFSVVLLDSRPASVPLAEFLQDSPLWTLSAVSPWGYVFQTSGGKVDHPAGPNSWDPPWVISPKNRALWFLGTASSLAAIHQAAEAKRLLASVEETHLLPSLCLSGKASLEAESGNWREAKKLAAQAVGKDPANVASSMILTRALIECGEAGDALVQARALSEAYPDDAAILFLRARAANAANATSEEIEVLLRLVHRNEAQQQPLGASLAYLAQAYAKNGQRGLALTTFERALRCPEMNGDQKKMLTGIMDHLMPAQASTPSLPPPGNKSSDSSRATR
jgi:hypothetical protein